MRKWETTVDLQANKVRFDRQFPGKRCVDKGLAAPLRLHGRSRASRTRRRCVPHPGAREPNPLPGRRAAKLTDTGHCIYRWLINNSSDTDRRRHAFSESPQGNSAAIYSTGRPSLKASQGRYITIRKRKRSICGTEPLTISPCLTATALASSPDPSRPPYITYWLGRATGGTGAYSLSRFARET